MSHKIRFFAAPLALAAGLAFASPALAQTYSPNEIRNQIDRMEYQIEEIGETRRFTNSEYRQLLNRIDGLRSSYRQYARDGFSRRELSGLSERVDNVRRIIRVQARDGDRLRR